MTHTALLVSASAQQDVSLSRQLAEDLIDHLQARGEVDRVLHRDLSNNDLQFVTQAHIGAFYTPPTERSPQQQQLLSQSDTLLDELKSADVLVLATPMYNFSVPAVLKAWIDLICRVGETFRYTPAGPEGLSRIKKAYIVVATGGAPIDSAVDFVVPYLKQVMKFIGINEIEVVAADRVNAQREQAIASAREAIAAL